MTNESGIATCDGIGLFVIVTRKSCSDTRKLLQRYDLFDVTRKIEKCDEDNNMMAVPLKGSTCNSTTEINLGNVKLRTKLIKLSSRKEKMSPCQTLQSNLKHLVNSNDILKWDSQLSNDVAQRWEKHGDLVILPQRSFTDSRWLQLVPQVWQVVAESLKVTRVARRVGSVTNDEFRSPRVVLLLGDDPMVEHVDIGIRYTFDITKCMFSMGNIVEKQRIAKFDCSNEVVVDLYAGIGYFTLPYLVHANAMRVHACEWNPASVASLERNLIVNGVRDRCTIYFGDNREVCPRDVADRVNLGLLPDSEPGWEIACKALKSNTGGILHIHGIVDVRKNGNWKQEWANIVKNKIYDIFKRSRADAEWKVEDLNIVKVKSYAPKVEHLVLDLRCSPINRT